MTRFRAKSLDCGCCGAYFRTWPEYVDQDQDAGYGICQPCQEWIEGRNLKIIDDARAKLRAALNDKNQAKFDAMSADAQRGLTMKAFEDGMFKWTIDRRQPTTF